MQHTKFQKPSRAKYDLVVIGSGPGGQRAAVQAAKLRKTVLVIENDALGGACLHKGTVPSKTLREAALFSDANDRNLLAEVMERKTRVIQAEMAVFEKQFSRNNVEWIHGTGSFVDRQTIRISSESGGSYDVSADIVVIGTGTRPRREQGVVFDGTSIFDSDSILELPAKPKSMAIIGAGVIGCEYTSIFARLGVAVTLIDRRDCLLRFIDQEIVNALAVHLDKNGVETKLSAKFDSIQAQPEGGATLNLNGESRKFDSILYCMGRVGNLERLNLEAAGLAPDSRGLITVNKQYQTSVPHIYAVGDIIGLPALAASSAEQGRLAAAHAFGNKIGSFLETFPYGIYTIPEISSVGAQEDDLKKENVSYVTGIAHYRELARGKILDDDSGFLKIIVDRKTEKILGVHVIGTGATELVHIGQAALALGATIDFFVNNVFNYPTLAEAYKVAAYNAFNKLSQPA